MNSNSQLTTNQLTGTIQNLIVLRVVAKNITNITKAVQCHSLLRGHWWYWLTMIVRFFQQSEMLWFSQAFSESITSGHHSDVIECLQGHKSQMSLCVVWDWVSSGCHFDQQVFQYCPNYAKVVPLIIQPYWILIHNHPRAFLPNGLQALQIFLFAANLASYRKLHRWKWSNSICKTLHK